MQRDDFRGIFRAMSGLPVTIRLLDPPLHEFLPHNESETEALARDLGVDSQDLKRKVEGLKEFNPMLGHRGCRLAITYPEIYEMQARAIFEAAVDCAEQKFRPLPEIMIPLVAEVEELKRLRELVEKTAREVMRERGTRLRFQVGTMIEVPRAALTADRVAEVADFFSFGTNDLTQTTLALSRDDAGRFLPTYVEKGVLPADPFVTLDISGVGELIRIGVRGGRRTRPDLKVGICGEHGGDPQSIEFCQRNGFDYVSCSPYRVPIARLAAARSALDTGRGG
jgi:pyruvate,orthophosphate dikinase